MSRTALTRLAHKATDDRGLLDALLDEVLLGHVGLVREDGTPAVLPSMIARDGDRVLIHGSTGSPWMRRLGTGVPACLTVTAVDALVVARSAFESSMRYRSAVLYGVCEQLGADEKSAALDTLTERFLPGRPSEVRRPSAKELAATLVLALPIREWSLKVSAGWPEDLADDVAGDAWAGIVPVIPASYGSPVPAPDLRPGVPVPPSVTARSGGTV